MSIRAITRRAASGAVAALLCACAAQQPYQAYPGNPLPPGQDAHISGFLGRELSTTWLGTHPHDEIVLIFCVDDRSTANAEVGYTNAQRYPDQVNVQPGHHTLMVQYQRREGLREKTALGQFQLEAQAGHSYLVNRAAADNAVQLWIEDQTEGHAVGTLDLTPREFDSKASLLFTRACGW